MPFFVWNITEYSRVMLPRQQEALDDAGRLATHLSRRGLPLHGDKEALQERLLEVYRRECVWEEEQRQPDDIDNDELMDLFPEVDEINNDELLDLFPEMDEIDNDELLGLFAQEEVDEISNDELAELFLDDLLKNEGHRLKEKLFHLFSQCRQAR